MGNDELKILIAAELKKSTEQDINRQLKALKLDTLKLNVDIGKETSNINRQVQVSIRQTQASVDNNPINLKIIADQRQLKGLQEQLKALTAQFKGIDKYAQGELITNNVGAITGAKVTYNDPKLQQTITQTYELDAATNKLYNSQNKLIDNSAKQATTQKKLAESMRVAKEQSLNFASGIDSQIKGIDSKTLKRSKPLLPDSKQFEDYNSKLIETKEEISAITSQNEILSGSHRRQINSMVKDLERYASELQTSAYASDKLRPDTFTNAKALAQKSFDTTSQKWLSGNIVDDKFKSDLAEAKKLLDNAIDSSGLDAYRAKLKLLGEDFKQFQFSSSNLRLESGFDGKLENTITKHQKTLSQYSAMGSNKQLMEEYNAIGAKLSELKAKAEAFRQAGTFDKSLIGELSSVQQQMTGLNSKIVIAGKNTKSFHDVMSNAVKKFTEWGLASSVVMQSIHAVQAVVKNVIELDGAMVGLKKVTDESGKAYEQFFDRASVNAVKLGSSLTDLIDATADFSKLGFSLKDAEDMAQVATVYKNVGDDIADIGEATKDIITPMKAFGIAAKDSISIVDKYNEVSNKYAVSSGDLGKGVSNSASALALAGNNLDQSIAMITAMTEITQDAAESGNALKVLSMRLRGASVDLEAAGESTEGMVESTSKLQEEILALTNVNGSGGFDIMLNPDTFKSTYDIMLGISKVYEDMSNIDQAALLELIAGKQRGNSISALLTSMSQAENVLSDSTNSAGSAMQEQEKQMDSAKKKLEQLGAQFQAFSATVLDSGLIKGTFDAGSGILGFFTELIDTLGALPTLITVAAGAMSGFKNVGISNVKYAPPYPRGMAA